MYNTSFAASACGWWNDLQSVGIVTSLRLEGWLYTAQITSIQTGIQTVGSYRLSDCMWAPGWKLPAGDHLHIMWQPMTSHRIAWKHKRKDLAAIKWSQMTWFYFSKWPKLPLTIDTVHYILQWNLVTVRISGHSVKPRYIKYSIIWRFLYISTKIHIALLLFCLSLILDRCVYI